VSVRLDLPGELVCFFEDRLAAGALAARKLALLLRGLTVDRPSLGEEFLALVDRRLLGLVLFHGWSASSGTLAPALCFFG
jgi:hypothetical protein